MVIEDTSIEATDTREHLRRWDAGSSIWSVEMGGIGPGYEQAIQVLAIEIIRDNIDKLLPDPGDRDWAYDTVSRVDYRREDGSYALGGLSGAQVGAARQIAYRMLKDGPAEALKNCPPDRKILVSKFWPKAEVSEEHAAQTICGGLTVDDTGRADEARPNFSPEVG